MAVRVLVVEDDVSISEIIAFHLEKSGYLVEKQTHGYDALDFIQSYPCDLVILDWMLPDISGIEVLRKLRHDKKLQSLPVIMLTARSADDDFITGLDSGADDYLTKPFSPRELLSRVKAHLRRSQINTKHILTLGDIVMDLEKRIVKRGERDIRLGAREFDIMALLAERKGRVYTREMILDSVWGIDGDVEIRTVDVSIGRLRRALDRKNARNPILTVRGSGYMWDENYG